MKSYHIKYLTKNQHWISLEDITISLMPIQLVFTVNWTLNGAPITSITVTLQDDKSNKTLKMYIINTHTNQPLCMPISRRDYIDLKTKLKNILKKLNFQSWI